MRNKIILIIKKIISKIIDYKEPIEYGNRGNNVWIGDKCEFGNPKNIFLADCIDIRTANHYYDGDDLNMLPFDEKVIVKPVVIKENVWIGSHCLILPGVEIGEGAVVGAGSVVTKNVPALAVVGGAPAKVIKWRNEEQYNILKDKDKTYMRNYRSHEPILISANLEDEENSVK